MFEQKFENQTVQFRYLRTTELLKAEVDLTLPNLSRVYFFGPKEAEVFVETMRRRNVVARLGGQNNNYLRRASQLKNRTVIEIAGVGLPDRMLELGEQVAEVIENLAILATTFVMKRNELHRQLGIMKSATGEITLRSRTVSNAFGRDLIGHQV
jgi:hypothetical protein